jgi:hypothetical protein
MAFSKARAICDLQTTRFHDLRHFSMTLAAATGASTKELMRRAGRASPAAALRYQHATEDRDQAIANAFDEMLSGDVVHISKSDRSHPQGAQKVGGQQGDGL